MHEKIKVLLFCDQKDAVYQINHALKDTQFTIIGISSLYKQIMTLLVHYVPEFLIVSLQDECKDTNHMISKLKMISPSTRILVMHKDCSSKNVFHTIKAGADIFISDDVDLNELHEIMFTVMDNDIYLPDFVAISLLETSNNDDQAAAQFPFLLTDKEKLILRCFAERMNISTMAKYLGFTPEIVKAHTNNILQKMHFSDIAGKYYHEILSDYQMMN